MLKNRWFVAIALACTAGLTVGCDDDNDLEDVVDERIDELDLNSDTVVTRTEGGEAFVAFNTDNDQVLAVGEFPFNGAAFDLADTNHDGFVTQAEWNAFLAAVDVNNNGILEVSEFDAFL